MVDLVRLYPQWQCNVMPDQLKSRIIEQVIKIAPGTGAEVIDREDLMTERYKPATQV
jgi:hypothetical protein